MLTLTKNDWEEEPFCVVESYEKLVELLEEKFGIGNVTMHAEIVKIRRTPSSEYVGVVDGYSHYKLIEDKASWHNDYIVKELPFNSLGYLNEK